VWFSTRFAHHLAKRKFLLISYVKHFMLSEMFKFKDRRRWETSMEESWAWSDPWLGTMTGKT
jgi:hypothetical protein